MILNAYLKKINLYICKTLFFKINPKSNLLDRPFDFASNSKLSKSFF